jgi:hypothetical protein
MTETQQSSSEHISTEASKVRSADHKNSVTGFQGIRVYIIVMDTVRFANFFKFNEWILNNRGTSIIGDMCISYDLQNI